MRRREARDDGIKPEDDVGERIDEDILHYYPLANTQQKNGLSGPVVVGRRPCEPHNPTLLSLGGGSHLKRESHSSPIRLVF